MFTRQELHSSQVIGRCWRSYSLRKSIAYRVEKTKQVEKLKRTINKALKKDNLINGGGRALQNVPAVEPVEPHEGDRSSTMFETPD
jgi:hypothetical protein